MTATKHDFGDGSPVAAHRHAHGGGWVADTAHVDATAYVGSTAQVYGAASPYTSAPPYTHAPPDAGCGNYIHGTVRLADWSEVNDDNEPECTAVIAGDDLADAGWIR